MDSELLEEIARFQLPALISQGRISQGTTDLHVNNAEAEGLNHARPEARLLMIDGMNHIVKIVPLDLEAQQAPCSDPDANRRAGLIDGLRVFIR